jgi:hypothetical protein
MGHLLRGRQQQITISLAKSIQHSKCTDFVSPICCASYKYSLSDCISRTRLTSKQDTEFGSNDQLPSGSSEIDDAKPNCPRFHDVRALVQPAVSTQGLRKTRATTRRICRRSFQSLPCMNIESQQVACNIHYLAKSSENPLTSQAITSPQLKSRSQSDD